MICPYKKTCKADPENRRRLLKQCTWLGVPIDGGAVCLEFLRLKLIGKYNYRLERRAVNNYDLYAGMMMAYDDILKIVRGE